MLFQSGKVEEFRKTLEDHRFHIGKLETVLRFVDNDAVDLDKVRFLKRPERGNVKPVWCSFFVCKATNFFGK